MALQFGKAASFQVQLKGPYGSVSIRAVELTLPLSEWKGAVSPFSQVAALDGVTATCMVELQPGPALLEQLRMAGTGLMAENDGGQVTVYAFGEKPQADITMQATITEVQK